jgi:mevalonate pyrophosphate decarboxylase
MSQIPKPLEIYANHLKTLGYEIEEREISIIARKEESQFVFATSEESKYIMAATRYELNRDMIEKNKLEVLEFVNTINSEDLHHLYIDMEDGNSFLAVNWLFFGKYDKEDFTNFMREVEVIEIEILAALVKSGFSRFFLE